MYYTGTVILHYVPFTISYHLLVFQTIVPSPYCKTNVKDCNTKKWKDNYKKFYKTKALLLLAKCKLYMEAIA